MNSAEIAAKAVEISKALVNTSVGMHNFDLEVTRSIGDLTRLAVTLRRAGTIDSEQQMAAISQALKIDYRIAKNEILTKLDELNWIDIKRDGSRIQRIDEKIPPIEDVMSTLGKEWENKQPTVYDRGSIAALSTLTKRPYEKDAIQSEIKLNDEDFDVIYSYGNAATYLGSFKSEETNRTVIWTPLCWAGKLDTVEKFLSKQSESKLEHLAKLSKEIKEYQGVPLENVQNKFGLLDAGVFHGYFPSVTIKDRKEIDHGYVFTATPQFEPDPKQDIFEKARLLVACIRHGQYHAEISKIKYPRLILKAMRENVLSPHSYANIQYLILKLHNIVDIEEVDTAGGKRYMVRWIDSPENNIAADVADMMLRGDEPSAAATKEVEAYKIMVQGVYNYTAEQRKMVATRQIKAKGEFDRLMQRAIGVKG